MAYACKICIAAHGLRGLGLASLPQTEEELLDHLEQVHGFIIQDRPPKSPPNEPLKEP